ncbi:MAG TPA: response regulator, partial [Flavobacterium sp.]
MLKGKMNSRIILADDDADDRVIFSEALSEVRANQQLTVFSDGVELMNYLQQAAELPQLLFLDLNMPKKSGFECLREIRTNERYKDISIAIY